MRNSLSSVWQILPGRIDVCLAWSTSRVIHAGDTVRAWFTLPM